MSSRHEQPAAPAKPANPLVRLCAFLFARFVWVTLRIFLHVKLEGIDNVPRKGPVLLIANHPSYLEPAIFVSVSQVYLKRPIAFMAWDKLFRIPVVGPVIAFYGAFPVDLEKPGRKPYEHLLRHLREGGLAGIFPEGGRSESDLMGEWKPGALRAALSTDPVIVPVTVTGARDAWPRGIAVPRLFRRVTLVFHKGRKLDEIGDARDPAATSAKDWLKAIEEILLKEINAPIIAAREASKRRAVENYSSATPGRLRWKGTHAAAAGADAGTP